MNFRDLKKLLRPECFKLCFKKNKTKSEAD